jgi:Cu2+-exporting ATPase
VTGTTGDARCAHCNAALPAQPVVVESAGGTRLFCCNGCSAASEWISGADLGEYYRLRETLAGDATVARVEAIRTDYAAWDRDALQREHAHACEGGREITVLTDGMRCAACAWLIDRALRTEAGVIDAGANAVTGRIRIAWDPARTRLSTLLARLASLGYAPYLASGNEREAARRRERNRWLLRIGIAGLGGMQAMMLAEALYLDTSNEMPTATRDFFRWVTFLVSTPVVFWAGWPFIEGMWREWRGRRLGMDTLVAGSTLLAWAASVVETVRGGAHVWYDAAVMFVFLLLVARMIEQRARNLASAQVDALARARPVLAVRECADGRTEQVPVAELRAGDVLRVPAGETLPADGRLLEAAQLDEALLTGEATPVHKPAGAEALAGSIACGMPARLQVRQTGSDTRLSQLTRLVEAAQAQRPPLARLADRIASVFVATLLVAALLVWLGWRAHDPSRAFEVTLAVLVVSCPCALSLAIPAALAAGHGGLARIGVLALGPEALQRLARVTRVVFDKTGTLTAGVPTRLHVETFDIDAAHAHALAAALERDSTHPLAQAFRDDDATRADDVTLHAGLGIEGSVDGRRLRIGRAGFAAAREDDGAVWLGNGTQPLARFVLEQAPRADAAQALRDLHAQGIASEVCSGDGHEAVARLAALLNIDTHRARQSPEDKLAHVRALQARGEVVAMVGDGINDAPVLAGADVSLALADGAAIAQRAADLVILGGQLQAIPRAVALARRTRRVVRQNLAWALAYNVVALPLAATGQVTPWMAALGMAGSSLLVTLNALRLARPTAA